MCSLIDCLEKEGLDKGLYLGIKGILNALRQSNADISIEEFYDFVFQQEGYENISEEIVRKIFCE